MSAPFVAGSETSREASERIEPHAGTQRSMVLTFIRKCGPVADWEIQGGLVMDASSERPRRIELQAAGLIYKADDLGTTPAGRRCARYAAR